ncbi:MAG: hypothetical protein ACOCUQ_03910 [Bacteroidota bacterium]
MDRRFQTIFYLLILCLHFPLHAQEKKIEREKLVRQSKVPPNALEWISTSFDSPQKVKWYHEISGEGISYEAKFKHQKYKYSVKFDTTGTIKDVEKIIRIKEIETNARKSITNYFEENYDRFKILKTQIQYTGLSENLQKMIIGNKDKELEELEELEKLDITVKYEIEYRGKTKTEDRLWEGLFDIQGKLLSKRVIVLQENFNVEY